MADKNKRAVNGQGKAATPSTGPPAAHGSKFSADLRALTSQFQELVKSTGGVQEYGALLEAKGSLDKKLQDSQSDVSELRKEMKNVQKKHAAETAEMMENIEQLEAHKSWLQDDYGMKYVEWARSRKSHEATSKELSEAQNKLRESQKAADTARSEAHVLRRECGMQKKDLDDALRRCTSYKNQHDIHILEIEELKNKVHEVAIEKRTAVERLGMLPFDGEAMAQTLDILAQKIQMALKFVRRDLPDPSVAIELPGSVPIRAPGSNSRPAMCMRQAVAETLISDELRRSVFLDFYSGGDGGLGSDTGELRRAVIWLEKHGYQEKADVIRCQLARALASYAPRSSEQARQIAARVRNTLEPWIPDESTRREFEDGLTGIFEDAIELWRAAQQSEKWVTAFFDLSLKRWDGRVDRREDFDGDVSGGQAHRSSPGTPTNFGPPIAVLFPHIDTPDGEIFSGWALFQNQAIVVEASRELQSQQTSPGGDGPVRRRMSMRGPPVSGNRRVSTSSADEARLRRGSVGVASDASTSQKRSPVDPDTTASASSTRSKRSGAAPDGR